MRIKVTAKDGLRWGRTQLTADAINAIARTMDDVARDLLEFWRLNVGRCRLRFARHIAATVPANEIFPPAT